MREAKGECMELQEKVEPFDSGVFSAKSSEAFKAPLRISRKIRDIFIFITKLKYLHHFKKE